MTEPTLTINRQLAQEAAENLRRQVHPVEPSAEKVYLRIIEQYLALTDPEPLTAEHCPRDWVRDAVFQSVTSPDGGTQFDYHGGQRYLTVCEATLGQLNLELLKEKRDGE